MSTADAPRTPPPPPPRPADRPDHNVPPAPRPGPGVGGLILTVVLSLACGFVGSWAARRYTRAPGPVGSRSYRDASPDSPPVSASDLQSLTDRVDRMSQDVDTLKTRKDESPKGVTSADFETLRVRVAGLTKTADNLASVPGRVEHLANQVAELGTTLQTVRGDLAAVRRRAGDDTVDTPGSAPPVRRTNAESNPPSAAPDTQPRPLDGPNRAVATGDARPPANDDRAALERIAGAFRRGDFKDALKEFHKVELNDPEDARVWYYAALSEGFATGDWTGAAATLVQKGIDRESAGTPPRAEIDSEFRDLTTATGRDWLAAYRRRASTEGANAPQAARRAP